MTQPQALSPSIVSKRPRIVAEMLILSGLLTRLIRVSARTMEISSPSVTVPKASVEKLKPQCVAATPMLARSGRG